ncbi:MAG: hemolysin III family protein [Deltaproteobacteria bacterium]|nr:hemolysin III family protein [Deltaproteobacteria bacterium]
MDAVDRLCLGRMQNPVRGFLHGSAAMLSMAGGAVLWRASEGDVAMRLALLVFAASLVGLYTVSSLYHSFPWRAEWKRRMQRLDHSMIYVLVAGTYTPIALAILDGWLLAAALAATWGITIVGVAQKVFWPQVPHGVSITLQIVQGWLALPFIGEVARTLPPGALWLVVLGGLSYTVGAVFFVTRRPRLWPHVFSYHEVFHVCVVAGSALHYAAILGYVARFPGA